MKVIVYDYTADALGSPSCCRVKVGSRGVSLLRFGDARAAPVRRGTADHGPPRACSRSSRPALTVYLGAVVNLMSQETRLVFQAGRGLGTSRPSRYLFHASRSPPLRRGPAVRLDAQAGAPPSAGCCSCTATRQRSAAASTSRATKHFLRARPERDGAGVSWLRRPPPAYRRARRVGRCAHGVRLPAADEERRVRTDRDLRLVARRGRSRSTSPRRWPRPA